MNKKIFIVALGFLLCGAAFAQSVTVTPEKIVYTRAKPLMDFKKEFSITYPKIGGVPKVLAGKIERTISFESVLKFSLKDELSDYQWLEEATYEVGLNERGLLSIELTVSGTGAYPSSYGKNVVVDLKTGNRVSPAVAFVDLNGLASKCRAKQRAEIRSALETIRADEPDFSGMGDEILSRARFGTSNLDWFIVGKEGVTFVYDYGFPHIAQALEPDGRYFFTWAEIKPHIRRSGLLGKFIR